MGSKSPYYPDWMSDEAMEEWQEERAKLRRRVVWLAVACLAAPFIVGILGLLATLVLYLRSP